MSGEPRQGEKELFAQNKEANRATAQQLVEEARTHLGRVENPLRQRFLEILEENATIVFSQETSATNFQEQKVSLALLSLFARNNWLFEKRKGGILRESGGVRVNGHWRVSSKGELFLLVRANGRVDLEEQKKRAALGTLLTLINVGGDCQLGVESCLSRGHGPRLLVCQDKLGVILETRLQNEKLVLSSPAFTEKEVNLGNGTIDLFEKLVTTPVYPPQEEINF